MPPFGRTVPGNRWDLLNGEELPPGTRISVIVVHYEQPEQLERTLTALARQSVRAHEIIVVDDGSAHPPQVGPDVRLVVQEDRGFRVAAARNAGAAAATGDVLCFLDADTAPEPGFLAAVARLPALLPEALVVGRRRHADFADVSSAAPVDEVGPQRELQEPEWLTSAYRRTHNLLEADDTSYRFVIGALFACSRWLFDEVGGFDESFDAYGGEDWDFAYRAWLGGAILAHEPGAAAWHDGPEFAERDDAGTRRAQKAVESLTVARSIPAPGARGDGLFWRAADVVATIPRALEPAAAVITIDALLAAIPSLVVVVGRESWTERVEDPRVIVDDELHASLDAGPVPPLLSPLDRVRRIIRCRAPFTVDPAHADELTELLSPTATERWATLTVTSGDGPLLDILDVGAHRRRQRWELADLHPDREMSTARLRPLPPGARIAAHFGGWL